MDALTEEERSILSHFMNQSKLTDIEMCINLLEVSEWNPQAASSFIQGDPVVRPLFVDEIVTNQEQDEADELNEQDDPVPANSLFSLIWNNWMFRPFISILHAVFEFLKSFFVTPVISDISEEPDYELFTYFVRDYQRARRLCVDMHIPALLYLYRQNAQCLHFQRDVLFDWRVVDAVNSFPMILWTVSESDHLPLDLQSRIATNSFPAVFVISFSYNNTVVYQIGNIKNARGLIQNLTNVNAKLVNKAIDDAFLREARHIMAQQQQEYQTALINDQQIINEPLEIQEEPLEVNEQDWNNLKEEYRQELAPETSESGSGVFKLRIRFPTGRTIDRKFMGTDSCRDIYRFAYLHEDAPYRMTISLVHPLRRIPCELSDGPDYLTVGELGFPDRSVLAVYDIDA